MNGALPAWIQRWLGVEAVSGEGTSWRLEHAWPAPPWVTVLLLAVLVALVIAVYRRTDRRIGPGRRAAMAALRLGAMFVVLMMIAQVALSLQRTGLPPLVVLLDTSKSMAVADPELQPTDRQSGNADAVTRWDAIRAALQHDDASLPRQLAERYRLSVYRLSDPPSLAAADSEKGGAAVAVDADGYRALASALDRIEPDVPATRLGDAVLEVLRALRGNNPAAIVLMSDGINTEGTSLGSAAAAARRRDVPIHAIAVGSDRAVADLWLRDVLVDEFAFVGDVLSFDAKLSGNGLAGKTVDVELRREEDGTVLARQQVTIPPGGRPIDVRLTHRPERVGERRFVVVAKPLPEETQTENNSRTCPVTVSDEKIRVLLVQNYPSFEFRYLRTLLTRSADHSWRAAADPSSRAAADPSSRAAADAGNTGANRDAFPGGIVLDAVLQQADPELTRGPSESASLDEPETGLCRMPVRPDQLLEYDVIILGDVDPGLVSTSMLEGLARYVERPDGGAMVLIAGPRYMPTAYADTPLERLMPFNPSAVRLPSPGTPLTRPLTLTPTPLGQVTPPLQLGGDERQSLMIWRDLAPVYWLAELPPLKPGVRVLATAPPATESRAEPAPAICLHYVGAGKVLFHATDSTWRWRWRTGDAHFERYWRQMLRYLARSKLFGADRNVVVTTDRREYPFGEEVRLRVVFRDDREAPAGDDDVTVVLQRADETTQRILPTRDPLRRGTFETTVEGLDVGDYRAWLALPAVDGEPPAVGFRVVAPPGEFARTRVDTSALKRAAERAGGRFHTLDQLPRLIDHLPPGRQVPIEALPGRPLWNRWPLLVLLVLLLGGEWIIRKRASLS